MATFLVSVSSSYDTEVIAADHDEACDLAIDEIIDMDEGFYNHRIDVVKEVV